MQRLCRWTKSTNNYYIKTTLFSDLHSFVCKPTHSRLTCWLHTIPLNTRSPHTTDHYMLRYVCILKEPVCQTSLERYRKCRMIALTIPFLQFIKSFQVYDFYPFSLLVIRTNISKTVQTLQQLHPHKNNKRQLHTASRNHNEPDGMGIESRRWPDFRHPFRSTLGLTQPPTQWVLCSSLGQFGHGVVLTTHPHLAPRWKKAYSYTCTPPLGFHGLFCGELYFNSQLWGIYILKAVNVKTMVIWNEFVIQNTMQVPYEMWYRAVW